MCDISTFNDCCSESRSQITRLIGFFIGVIVLTVYTGLIGETKYGTDSSKIGWLKFMRNHVMQHGNLFLGMKTRRVLHLEV